MENLEYITIPELLTSIKMQRHERFLKQEKREGIKDS
jgi:hypothetical protein